MTQLQQVLDLGYEVKLPVFEGPLDLLLYLVEKNELNPKDVSIASITDQYLEHLQAMQKANLGEAGEFLVMAARLMRLKARELLPADEKDPLEEMEYLLDRQALIAQMMEYQKFKEAARSLRSIESRNFGGFPRGRAEKPGRDGTDSDDATEEGEAGIYDLLAAFKTVLSQKPRIPVHEVEIDEVTIEDRMQHIETELLEAGRCLFEDLFGNDPRRMAKVVTFMALLELCKLDRIVIRQNRALGSIWVYPKQAAAGDSDTAEEIRAADVPVDEPSETGDDLRPGLVDWVQEQILQRKTRTVLDEVLAELDRELKEEGGDAPHVTELEPLAEAALDRGGPDELAAGLEDDEEPR